MSSNIVLPRVTAQQALDYKKQLDADGLIINQDYHWNFRPVKYNDWSMAPTEQSQVEFEFRDGALASFYKLKWAK